MFLIHETVAVIASAARSAHALQGDDPAKTDFDDFAVGRLAGHATDRVYAREYRLDRRVRLDHQSFMNLYGGFINPAQSNTLGDRAIVLTANFVPPIGRTSFRVRGGDRPDAQCGRIAT
jgi:hypothetical protein